jgi:uncharacterized membrane protein
MQTQELRTVDHWVAVILRGGAYGSVALLLLGLLIQLLAPSFGIQVMRFAVLLLLSTPVLRVITLLFLYLRARDWKYAVISAVVLLIVLASSFFGIKL